MKKIRLLMILGIVCMLGQVSGQESKYHTETAHMGINKSDLVFAERRINVGYIKQGDPIEVDFQFINEGSSPVVIQNVRTSCGCTAAKHSAAPVRPGESSYIRVSYDAKAKGFFNKSVYIETSSDEKPIMLLLAGEVI